MLDKEICISEMSAIEYLHDFIDTYLTLTDRERKILNLIRAGNGNLYMLEPPPPKQLTEKEYMETYGLYLCQKCGKYKKAGAFTQNKKICKRCLNGKDEERKIKRKTKK